MSDSVPNKHAARRLGTYLATHATVMGHLRDEGFVSSDTLSIDPYGDDLLMQGEIGCLGEIVIKVRKLLTFVGSDLIQTTHYVYNVRVLGMGNVFRYDNSHVHAEHLDAHHKDVFRFPTEERLASEWIGVDRWPTLGEVIRETQQWHAANRALLRNADGYPPHEVLAAEIRA